MTRPVHGFALLRGVLCRAVPVACGIAAIAELGLIACRSLAHSRTRRHGGGGGRGGRRTGGRHARRGRAVGRLCLLSCLALSFFSGCVISIIMPAVRCGGSSVFSACIRLTQLMFLIRAHRRAREAIVPNTEAGLRALQAPDPKSYFRAGYSVIPIPIPVQLHLSLCWAQSYCLFPIFAARADAHSLGASGGGAGCQGRPRYGP